MAKQLRKRMEIEPPCEFVVEEAPDAYISTTFCTDLHLSSNLQARSSEMNFKV